MSTITAERKKKKMDNLTGSINIVLIQPEIPPNTGNVARLCAATGSRLHLVHPLGFRTDDKSLKRAGLDYWPHVDITHHGSIRKFLEKHGDEKLLLFTKKASRIYTRAPYRQGCWLLFGSETSGLPASLLQQYRDNTYMIPMKKELVRSLNLSTAAGIAAYEAYRQINGW